MATPYVTGILALIKEVNPTSTNLELRNQMQSSVLDLGLSGKDTFYGYGLVQAPFSQEHQQQDALSFTKVTTDKNIYVAGDIITVRVKVTNSNQENISDSNVSLTITPPKGSSMVLKGNTDINGSCTFLIDTNKRSITGDYGVHVENYHVNYTDSQASTTFKINKK